MLATFIIAQWLKLELFLFIKSYIHVITSLAANMQPLSITYARNEQLYVNGPQKISLIYA